MPVASIQGFGELSRNLLLDFSILPQDSTASIRSQKQSFHKENLEKVVFQGGNFSLWYSSDSPTKKNAKNCTQMPPFVTAAFGAFRGTEITPKSKPP